MRLMKNITVPVAQTNNPAKAGQLASARVLFGDENRFAVYAVHTRFADVTWFVTDADITDEVTGRAAVVRQEATAEAAIAGVLEAAAARDARKAESIKTRLRAISLGRTATVHGRVVTRWADDAFEVGTWARGASLSLGETVAVLMGA